MKPVLYTFNTVGNAHFFRSVTDALDDSLADFFSNALLLQGHRVAHAYLQAHGRMAPVHCHTIEGGKISLEPELYVSLEEQFRVSSPGIAAKQVLRP